MKEMDRQEQSELLNKENNIEKRDRETDTIKTDRQKWARKQENKGEQIREERV